MSKEHLIKIENLRNCAHENIRENIVTLFTKYLNIGLTEDKVDIGQNQQLQFAVIYLKSKNEVEKTLDILSSKTQRKKLGFKFSKLVHPRTELEVKLLKFYREGELIGMRNKTTEFKQAKGDYIEKHLKEDVIKYMCGFLNCSGCGTLYLGVTKKGLAVGLNCDHIKPHKIQKITDEVMETVHPFIPADRFSIEFTPVYTTCGIPKHQFKVVEINISNKPPTCLYSVANKVFIRKITRVEGPLTMTQVLSYSHEIHVREIEKERHKIVKDANNEYQALLEQTKTDLQHKMNKELKRELEKVQQERDQELDKLKQVAADINDSQKSKSKTCLIM